MRKALLTFVLSAHALFVIVILIAPTFHVHKKKHKQLVVKTVVKSPVATPTKSKPRSAPPAPPVATARPQAKLTPPPAATTKPQAKPTPPAAPKPAQASVKKTSPSTPKPAAAPVKKTPPPAPASPKHAAVSDALLKELEASIAQMDSKSPRPVPKSSVPPAVALQIDAAEEEDSADYADMLVAHLHRVLSLPEYGEVKIQLSLRQDGSVIKMVVLKAQSEKNRRYLESALPSLTFPRFEGMYVGHKEHTFVLTFCNQL